MKTPRLPIEANVYGVFSRNPSLFFTSAESGAVAWKPPPTGLSAVTCIPQELWQMVSTYQVWLQDMFLRPRVNGVAGLGAPKFEQVFVFCRTSLRLAALIWAWRYHEDVSFSFLKLSSATCESWPALCLGIFSQQCSLAATLTAARSSWKPTSWFFC